MKDAPGIAVEVIELRDLDSSREGNAYHDRRNRARKWADPIIHHPSQRPEMSAGPNVRAGFVLVPESAVSRVTITA